MIFLYITLLFLNLYTGFLFFSTFFRTDKLLFQKINLACSVFELLLYFTFPSSFNFTFLILYTPLFIGILPLFIRFLTRSRLRKKNYETSLTLLECVGIHLQMGQSFPNSLGLALANLPTHSDLDIFFKKNVVLQQPKSRNCPIFDELTQNLNTLSQQSLGKKELLGFIKHKFQLNSELEQKIQLSSTQYKAQSYALIIFWFLALLNLMNQGVALLYINTIAFSFFLMSAGLLLSRKLLVKTKFRI